MMRAPLAALTMLLVPLALSAQTIAITGGKVTRSAVRRSRTGRC